MLVVPCGCHGTRIEGEATGDTTVLDLVDLSEDILPEPDPDAPASEVTLDLPAPPDASPGAVPVLPPTSSCGDGTVDPGEECDDGNRLDGDGCTWDCRVGDGDPTPLDPVPGTPTYHDTDPELIEGYDNPWWLAPMVKMPLVWTGSLWTTAFLADDDAGNTFIRLVRITDGGVRFDGGWIYYLGDGMYRGLDLLWTGEIYALFFAWEDLGILFLELDVQGKLLGDPVLVVPDPDAVMPSADLAGDGFVLAWSIEPTHDPGELSGCFGEPHPEAQARMRLLGPHGATEGYPGPVTVLDDVQGYVDVATGEGGFGISTMVGRPVGEPCSPLFVRVSGDLDTVVQSGLLSRGIGGEAAWAGDHWAAAWTASVGTSFNVCIGTFGPDGDLLGAPVCMPYPASTWVVFLTSLVPDAHGLARLICDPDAGLFFLYSDPHGVPVSIATPIFSPEVPGGYGLAHGDDAFGVLSFSSSYLGPTSLYFTRMEPD